MHCQAAYFDFRDAWSGPGNQSSIGVGMESLHGDFHFPTGSVIFFLCILIWNTDSRWGWEEGDRAEQCMAVWRLVYIST